MNNSIFETKEQYLAFRAAFAAAQNDKRAKHYFTEVETTVWDHVTKKYGKMPIKVRNNGWLQAPHFVLLNAIRGLPLNRGFTSATNANKIASYHNNPTEGYDWAVGQLNDRLSDARRLIAGVKVEISAFTQRSLDNLSPEEKQKTLLAMQKEKEDQIRRRLAPLLDPFQGALTIEQFAKLDLGGEK